MTTSTQVTVGYLNASHAHHLSNPTLPEPGKIQKYEFGKSPFPALITIHQDREHASHLELPIIGTAWRAVTAR
jgi:hypothetical protein